MNIGYTQNASGSYVGRFLIFHLFRASGDGNRFQLEPAGIPNGTPISLGLKLPDGARPESATGDWGGGIAAFGEERCDREPRAHERIARLYLAADTDRDLRKATDVVLRGVGDDVHILRPANHAPRIKRQAANP